MLVGSACRLKNAYLNATTNYHWNMSELEPHFLFSCQCGTGEQLPFQQLAKNDQSIKSMVHCVAIVFGSVTNNLHRHIVRKVAKNEQLAYQPTHKLEDLQDLVSSSKVAAADFF